MTQSWSHEGTTQLGCLERCFVGHRTVDDKHKTGIFLACVGPKTYELGALKFIDSHQAKYKNVQRAAGDPEQILLADTIQDNKTVQVR